MNTPIEYDLRLSTGEIIRIAELDPGRVGPLSGPFLPLCSHVSRASVEEAKRGHTKPLEHLLRTPPVGCLVKAPNPLCSSKDDCIMADAKKCTLRNVTRTGGRFPICWTAGDPVDEMSTYVAHAWRQGMHVLLVDA